MRLLAFVIVAFVAAGPELPGRDGAAPATWRAAPALTRLFAPIAAPPGSCVVSTSQSPIEQVVRTFLTTPGADAGAWHIRSAGMTEAFGTEGPYDRARLARLFNGGRIRMARGSVTVNGGTIGYTLVSPVPDAAFETLRTGTMIVAVDVRRMLTAVRPPPR